MSAGSTDAGPSFTISVLGQNSSAAVIPKGSTSAYGALKLTAEYTSTDDTLAATGKSILAAIQALDVDAVGGGTGEYISKISETDGKISATKATTTVTLTYSGATTGSPTIKATVNGINSNDMVLAIASTSAAGVVTTGDQSFGGAKTFGNITLSGSSDTAKKTISSSSTLYLNRAASCSLIFQLGGTSAMRIDTANAFRPETNNTLTIGTSSYKWKGIYATTFYGALSGNATSASKLNPGANINGTLFTGESAITTSYWGSARNISIKDADESHEGTATAVDGSGPAVLYLPSTIKATLEGNADTATNANNADKLDNYHAADLFENLSIAGNTLTIKIGNTEKTASVITANSLTLSAGHTSNAQTITSSVNGITSAVTLAKATTSVWGVIKLTNSYTSTDGSLAVTGKAILAAITTLKADAVGGGTGEYISKISETGGIITATKATTTVVAAWTGGTTAGPSLKVTVNSIASAAAVIPSASAAASGVVTTATQRFRGEKQLEYPTITSNNSRYLGFCYKNNALTQVAEHWYDVGNAANITSGVFNWRQYSYKTAGDGVDQTTTTGFYETYSLPKVAADLTAHASYSILTTKNHAAPSKSTATYMAYYSAAGTISGTSNARMVEGALQLHPANGSYREGLRIYPTSSWTTIVLGGNDLTANSGTSANSWSIHNNNGTFYINKNGSSGAAAPRAMATSTGWTFGNTTTNSYALNSASFICDSWVRTKGDTGWYSQDHGGGWYMTDNNWIRSYNNKPVFIAINTHNAWGIGGHRLALGLQGASHVSLMLRGGDVMYGFAVNNDGNWYFGKRTNKSFESTTDDAYCYYGNATQIMPSINNAVNLGAGSQRWKNGYWQGVIYVGNTSYTAWNSATNGTYIQTAEIGLQRTTAGGGFYIIENGTVVGRWYCSVVGTADAVGQSQLTLGNSTASGTAHNSRGVICIFGANGSRTAVWAQANGNRDFFLPNYAGAMYAVHAGDNSAVGNVYTPVYVAANGRVTIAKALPLYEARGTTTTLNKAANYVGAGAMFHLVASSSTATTDNGKPPMGDANVLQMNWDNNGGYDAQLAISTAANRMEFRDQISTKKAWREVVTSTPGTAAGGANKPVYISTTGVATACNAYSSILTGVSWTAGTTAGPTVNVTAAGTTKSAAIPSASASASGAVTTGAQTFAGNKTFNGTTLISATGSNRATLQVVTPSNNPCDLYLGANNANKWSITCRASGESYFLGFYSTTRGWNFRMFHDGNNYNDGELHVSGWVRFPNYTGLYSPNNSAHFYPNNATTYGQWCLQGSKGGYSGIQLGNSTAYMTLMDQGTYKGLFQEGVEWIFCYRKDVAHVGIGNSTCSYKLHVSGDIYANGGWLRSSGSAGWYSESYGGGIHMTDSTWVRIYNGKKFYVSNGEENAIYTSGGVLAAHPNAFRAIYADHGFIIRTDNSNTYMMPATGAGTGNTWYGYYTYIGMADGYWHFPRAYGAVWNDYAEYRQASSDEPGRVVKDTLRGTMELVDERLAAGCKVISDTYGFAIGETADAKTPIAVSGRVLVYPYRDPEEYPIGAAVCSAPNGTVDLMTREEIMMYPERIIGTVSEIPDYDIWKQTRPDTVGDGKPVVYETPVRGRIWIYVK